MWEFYIFFTLFLIILNVIKYIFCHNALMKINIKCIFFDHNNYYYFKKIDKNYGLNLKFIENPI